MGILSCAIIKGKCERNSQMKIVNIFLFAFLVGFTPSILSAGTFNWAGGGEDTKWSNPANWSENAAPAAKEDICVFNVAEDLETDFDLKVSPVIEKRGAGKFTLGGEEKYNNTVNTGSLFLYEGSIDLGGGTAKAYQPSRYADAVIGGNTSIDNGTVTYDGASINGEYGQSAGCLAFKEGVFKIGKNANFTIAKTIFSFSSDASEVTGQRTLLVDGGKLTVNGSSYVIGVDEDWTKAAVLDIRNGAQVTFGNPLIVGARFSTLSSKKAAGFLRVNDSTFSGGNWFRLTVANECETQGSRAVAAFTNSVVTIEGRDGLGIEVNNFARSHSDTHLIFNNTTATLCGLSVRAREYKGGAEIEGRRTEDGRIWTGVMTLDNAILKPKATTAQFIYNDSSFNPTVELLAGGGIIDTEVDVTVPAVAFGPGGWTKRGSGKLVLSGANLYRGATRVEKGILELTGSVAGAVEVIGADFSATQSSTPFRLVVNGGSASFNSIEPAIVDTLTVGENGGTLSFFVKGFTINNISGDLSKLTIESKLAEWGLGEVLKSNSLEFLEWARSYFAEKAPEGIELSVSGSSLIATMSDEKITTWTGLGENSLWATSDNWSEGVPSVYGSIVFGPSKKTDIELNSAISLTAVEFSSVAPSYSVSGSGDITVVGGLTNFSENVQTFNVPVALPGATMPLHAVGDIEFAAGIEGSDIIKTGSGNAIFTSSYNGKLAIREGGIVLSQNESKNLKLSEDSDAVSIAGLLDFGGGSLAINQSENGESVFKDGAVLKNGNFTYTCPKLVWNSSSLNGTALIWNEGTITIGQGAVFSPAGQLFAYGPSAPADTHGERRILVDGGELVLGNSPIYIIGVDNDWEKGAIIEVTNGGRLTSNYGNTIMIGARNNGSGTSKSAKGLLLATNGSLIDVKNNVWLLNPATHKNYGRIALTNSTMIIRADNGLSIMPVGDSSQSDVGVDVASGAVLSAKVINVKPHEGTGILNGRRVGGITLDNGTLQSLGGKNPFISYNGTSGLPGIELLAGGGIIDTQEYNVTNNVVVYGEGSLKKIGSGSLTLSAINTYTGTTLVSEGTLRLTGRVAGNIQVASGASLELSFPAEGEEAPEVPNLLMEEESALKAIVPGLPEGVKRIDVLRSSGEISIPHGVRDESGNVFYVSSTSAGKILRYGQKQGFAVLVR